MGRRPLRKRHSLKPNQKTICHYFKKRPSIRMKKKFYKKNNFKRDDESYILPSNIEDSDDYSKLDLDDETVDSQLRAPLVYLDGKNKKSKEVKIKVSRRKRKAYKPVIHRMEKPKRKRGRPRKINIENTEIKTSEEKNENVNNFEELNFCYNELSELISEYPFSDVADVIIKLSNDIKMNDSDKTEKTLFNKIGKINSVIKNKQDINTMCLSILATKISKNELIKDNNINKSNDINVNIPEEKPQEINPGETKRKEGNPIKENPKEEKPKYQNRVSSLNKNSKVRKVLNSFKVLNQSIHKFGMHFFNCDKCIYQYDPPVGVKRQTLSLYCRNRTATGCRAKCVVYSYTNDVTIKGEHNHEGITKKLFYDSYPELKNKDWEHAQIVKEDGEDIIIKQC